MSTVTPDDPDGTVGLCPVTGAVMRVAEIVRENGNTKKILNWVSDCAIHIHTETKGQDNTEFIFLGSGAIDKRAVKFTMPASSLAEPRKFKATLINAFGAKNRIDSLNFEMVQQMSLNPKLMQRVEVPIWKDRKSVV
jgi:hypothetical protein